MNSGRGPLLKYLCVNVVSAFLLFAFRFFGPISYAFPLSNLLPPCMSQMAEAPVHDKEIDSSRGVCRTWVLRSVERERNTHWAGWRQSGEAGWRAAGRAAVHLMNGGPG